MAIGQVVSPLPDGITSLVQEGLLERAFHDGLFPSLQYRAEGIFQPWEGNTGTEYLMTRPGLLANIVDPNTAGSDPQPQAVSYEQWSVVIDQYAGRVDTHMPTSAVAMANVMVRNVHQLGLQSGRSVNAIARNKMFQAYLSGSTVLTVATGSGDTTIQVASVNGFTNVLTGVGSGVRPVSVSPANPLPITIGTVKRNVVGFSLSDPTDPRGPGTLVLSASVGSVVAVRSPVLSSIGPKILRSGGGDSVDAISSADTLTLQDLINAATELRKRNVAPHDDGFYHAHLPPVGNGQIFQDGVYQRLNTALPEGLAYKNAFIGTIAGCMAMLNTESPDLTNVGALTATSSKAFYGRQTGSEVVNDGGTQIGRVLVTGKGVLYELGLDESQYVSEAGITGKIGEFDVVNNGLAISTERIRLILRAPINVLQDVVSAAWSITAGWAVPSDITGPGGGELFKRAVCIEFAQG